MLISLICSNQDLRIPSFVLYLKKSFNDVIVVQNSSEIGDNIVNSKKLGFTYYDYEKSRWFEAVKNHDLSDGLLLLNLDHDLTFKKLDKILGSNFSNLHDIDLNLSKITNVANFDNKLDKINSSIIKFENISWIYFSQKGLNNFDYTSGSNNLDLIRLTKSDYKDDEIKVSNRSLFEFNLNKNPLIYFGIPGLFLMFSSFLLVVDVVARYDSIDSVSLGTAIVTISTTVLGILSIMAAIISFIFGKQTEFILTNYYD
ncbi:MAG: hypothetical protein CMB64_07650 [Euryarchaeota archaeon]|nr:hypothetical protein [Euryarchaeota archaeon]